MLFRSRDKERVSVPVIKALTADLFQAVGELLCISGIANNHVKKSEFCESMGADCAKENRNCYLKDKRPL